MSDKEILALLQDESFCNYCLGKNDADIRHWEQWLKEHPEQRDQVEKQRILINLLLQEVAAVEIDRQFAVLQQQMNLSRQHKAPVIKLLHATTKRWIAAALIVLVAGIAWFYHHRDGDARSGIETGNQAMLAGSHRATLVLADGTRIDLANARNGEVAIQSGFSISKSAGGKIIYKASGDKGQLTRVAYNTLEIPDGSQYQIILPDGTSVFLNAMSTLRYPASFANVDARTVELTGEALFEIRHDPSQPFVVKTAKQTVTDVGTSVEIMSYPGEPSTKTMVISGSVRVSPGQGSRPELAGIQLKPGQEAYDSNGLLKVRAGDTAAALAWKSGYFYFRNADIRTVMREIGRWFNVGVDYSGNVTTDAFNGKIPRTLPLAGVLERLEATGFVHFKTAERKITVSQ